MSLLSAHDFHHRIDLFEPGDCTALVCVDVPEVQRLVVDNLNEADYKIHTGLFLEDILLKLQTHCYDVVVLSEHFGGTNLETNPLLEAILEIPAFLRRQQVFVLIGSSVNTDSDMQAWTHSVDLVVNLADVPNIKHVVRRAVLRSKAFYGSYSEALNKVGIM